MNCADRKKQIKTERDVTPSYATFRAFEHPYKEFFSRDFNYDKSPKEVWIEESRMNAF